MNCDDEIYHLLPQVLRLILLQGWERFFSSTNFRLSCFSVIQLLPHFSSFSSPVNKGKVQEKMFDSMGWIGHVQNTPTQQKY